MDEEGQDPIPEGFEHLPEGLGFTDTLQPCFRRVSADTVTIGLRVEKQHCNLMGFCHGGVLMTLADIAAATAVSHARGEIGGNPTLNLALDFIASAQLGQWLESEVREVSIKRRFAFASGILRKRDGIVARFNGTFYLPEHQGMWKVESPADGILPGRGR